MPSLYTYVPKNAEIGTQGIRTISTLNGDEWKKYCGRAGSTKKEDVLKWLEKTIPGRTKGVCVFTQPIPDNAPPAILAFRDSHRRVTIKSFDELKKDGIITACYAENLKWEPNTRQPEWIPADHPNWNEKLVWDGSNPKLLFVKTQHYLIITKDGVIPPKYLTYSRSSNESFMEEYSTITFPKEEIETISKQDRIITTRVSSDYNKFHEGDIVQTPWNKLYKVTNRLEITNIKDHPYYNELTKDQIAFLSKYDKIAVLTLMIQKDSNEALAETAIKDNYLYHGSPNYYKVLKPQTQEDVDGKKALSLSPYKFVASMFCTYPEEIMKGYRRCRVRYAEWFDKPKDKYKPLSVLHIYHNIKQVGNFEKIYNGYIYTVDAKQALENASDNPKWKGTEEVLSYVSEIHPLKIEKHSIKVIAEYNLEKAGIDYDAIPIEPSNEAFTANIKNNLVYHGSPRKLDKLAASASTTADAQGSVCVTPCKALAYCFAIDKDAVLGAVEKQFARRVLKCNFGYDIWNKPVSELYKVPQNITIELNIRGIKPIHGKSVGYIYTVDFDKYKNKCHMYHDSDVEIIINSDVDYIKREKVEVNWTCVSSELAIKRFGEGQLGTSDLGRESGEEGYKPGQMTITDIKSIDDLKAFYKTVKYGFRESDQDAITKWRLSTYRYLLHHPVGICYDTAVMSDHFLTQWNIKHVMLFMYADINKGWENTPTHMTVIYQDPNDKLYKWLEGSWNDFKNNNWAEKDPRVLVKNIAKAHANSCHHPVKIGAVEKAPLDGTCMIEFYNQVRAQCDHHLLASVEPDKQNAEEDLKADFEQTNTQFKEISKIDDAWWDYITEAVNLAAEASGDVKWTKQEVKDKITKNNIKVYALIQERYLPGKGRHFAEYFSLVGMSQFTPSTMYISNVAVMPKFQGKGFGKHLIRATIDKIRSEHPNKDIFINVATKNNRAKSLYEKVGFKEISTAENSIKMVLKADAPAMESFLDTMLSEEGLQSSAEALTRNITNYLNIGCHSEIKSAHPDWEKDAAFKVTEFFQNEKTEKSTLLKQIVSRIKLPSEKLTDETSTIEVAEYSRENLGPIARSIYEFYVKYIVRCNVFTQKLAQLYFDNHANEDWAHDVRIQQAIEQYDKNLLNEEQIINYAPYIVKEYGPVELKSAFDLIVDDYAGNYLSKLESTRRSNMFTYPDYWDPSNMPEFALVFYLAELTVMHHTSDLYHSALISYSIQDEQNEKALDMYGEIRELATYPVEVSTESLKDKEELPEEVKSKLGTYLYHGTHRDLDIKQLAVHFCKNRANREITAPVVYMTRSLGLASLHCAEFMKGHASKKPDYREHFIELDKAKDSNEIIKHVEIVHNDPDLKEASGENDGFIYCTKKENCIDKLYFSTPKKKNDYLFVSYSPLPVDKKIKIHITWHRRYDSAFADSVKKDKYAGVESLEYIPTITDTVSMEESPIQDAGKYYIIRGFPVYPFFARLKRYYNSTKLENLVTIVRSIGINSWFSNTRVIKIHKFFIPELIFLLNKFNMASNIIERLQKDTWLGEKSSSKTHCDINRVFSNLNCDLYPHQEKFIREYADHKDSHKLRGYLLSFSQGLGKTITSVALMEALGKERVIVICPKNTMVETWKSHFQRFYKKPQSIYVAGVDKKFEGQRFCIFNYDAIDKMNSMSGVKTANMGVIVDESHNFLRMQSSRTRKLIELAKESDQTDMLLMSGTPIKACGIEMIPMLSILDPMFDEEAANIFKLAFGTSVKIATDVLNARIHCIMERVTKDVLDLPSKTRTTIKIKLPDGQKYTVKEVRKGMEEYIRSRLTYHRDHMVEYRQEFDECMKFLNQSPIAGTEEFKKYKVILNRLIHDRGRFNQGDAEVTWMNQYEKTVVEKQFPSELLQKFRHCKAAIKYLHLKVRGEVLGQYLGKLRIEMTSAMLQKANLKQMIDEAQKKTIIFTSFVDTIETCEKYVRSLGYKPIVIYGKNSGEIAPLARVFQTDMTVNPLIASLQTLSTGATLTAANRVIFLNKPWRSVDYEQASDRVHRIGQDAPVDIISLVLDTGEQGNLSTRMEDIMDASAQAFDAIVEEHKEVMDARKKFSREDFYLPLDVLEECKYGEEYMNHIEPIDPSIEGMTLLSETHEQRVLNRMAKPHYREKGANSWEHVQQDIANAILLAKEVLHRKLSLKEYATVLYHDCGCKSIYPEKDGHGLRGVKIAKPELEKCGFFTNKEIDEICVAILEHDETTNPKNLHSSDLSDLLASADTNPPDIPWILNKSYVWGIRHGISDPDKNIQNVVDYMKKENGTKGNMIYPKLYTEYYKKEIKQMKEFFDNLTFDECKKIIENYRKENELRYNALTLPEPNTDEIVIPDTEASTEGMPAQYAKIQFANNPNKKRIWDLSKKYYGSVGCHGMNHIQEVLATAYVLKGRKDLTDVEYAAIVYHDVGRPEETETKHHNVISVEIAKKELPKLNIFTKEQLEEIYKAILNHSHSWRKAQNIKCEQLSGLSELLAYADRGFPQTTYYEICLRPTLWILEGNDRSDNPAKWERLHHYKTLDDIAQGVLETLDDIKGKRHDSGEDSLYTRAFAKERAIQDKLRNEISLDVIKPAIIKIMKDYKYTKAVGAEMYSQESIEPSAEAAAEAASKMSIKRKKIQDYILKAMKLLDPHTNVNTDYWKKKFDTMSDKDFDNFMHNLREGKENIHMYVPPFKVKLRNKELINAAHELGVKLMHRLWMKDAHTGIKYLTPEEYMVLQLPVRRQQQFLDEKLSVPDNDKTIDGLTGQVAGDSKCTSFTTPEIQIFHARNLDASLFEMANVRGGNINNYAEFKRSLEETGEVSLNQLDPMNRTRVAVIGQVFLTAMHLDINLVDI